MSLVKWSRPEVRVASTVDKRVHVSKRLNWRDVLTVLGRLEMDLRRKHAELRALDRRALNGTVRLHLLLPRNAPAEILSVRSDDAVRDLEPHVCDLLRNTRFADSGAPLEVEVDCIFDSDAPREDAVGAVNLFDEPVDDPFANPFADSAPNDDPGFGDPF